jgi:hypothetical protein
MSFIGSWLEEQGWEYQYTKEQISNFESHDLGTFIQDSKVEEISVDKKFCELHVKK